jgi:biotin carboxylase
MSRRGDRVLILAATTAYQTDDLVAAAERLGIEPVLATDRCHVLAGVWPEGAIAIDFADPEGAADEIGARLESSSIAGVVATDERTAVIAALAARALGLPHNPPQAVQAAANKLAFRRALAEAELPQPTFRAHPVGADPEPLARALGFPLVIKPLHLSASRGVMRADTLSELRERADRLARLLADPEVAARDAEAARTMLAERYVAGDEVAFEGSLTAGELHELAIFDKPDPLEGPFFAETIYVTPPRRPEAEIRAIRDAVAAAARGLGLREGAVHAELRLSAGGPVVLELAARSIGGLCGRTLRHGAGLSVEEVVLANAIGDDPRALRGRGAPATGVMMVPVPEAGVLREVEGIERAAAEPGVVEVAITARPGDAVMPLPEGSAYLGFIFASGPSAEAVTESLRRAGGALRPRIAPRL